MNVPTLLTVSGAALTIGLVVGGVISNLRKGNKEQQSEVIQLQQNEIAAFKSANERYEKDNAALQAKLAALQQAYGDVKKIAQQTPEVKQLVEKVDGMMKILEEHFRHDAK